MRLEIFSSVFGSCVEENEFFGESNLKGCFVASDGGALMAWFSVTVAPGVGVVGNFWALLNGEQGATVLA